ncbi:hypothetical protein [Xylanimonas ulmi]|uniref:FeoC-like transcriptional regulator n=1 Tax=Xylanimonas ulmi TaxID=228973 RepID=A0A4Q7LYY6_9MICO|nr:hypothetical protein [Xylanibacterium ulmi]RZS60124.1 hypothetical protein EV386_0367 [Xylanibacterium ulmi]
MSVLVRVLDAVRSGVSTDRLGSYLGVDDGLAQAALDHWVRLGLVTPAGDLTLGCSGCGPAQAVVGGRGVTAAGPACGGCPFSR